MPEVSAKSLAQVHHVTGPEVGLGQRVAKTVLIRAQEDEVDVNGHDAVVQDLAAAARAVGGSHAQMHAAVPVVKTAVLTPVAKLTNTGQPCTR